MKASSAAVVVTAKRHPLFKGAVNIVVDGLPAGFAAAPLAVAADQQTGTISVTIPEAAAAGEVPNVSLRVLSPSGDTILAGVPVRLLIE